MTEHVYTHGPIEPEHRETMNEVGTILAECFKGYGFALLVSEFNTNSGRMNYLSNAHRDDMCRRASGVHRQ
jgi:hypothetical protein